MSEIEAFPRAVLKHHYPETPLHGDFTTIREGEYDPIDVLVGGTPCQSFSVAGLRGGMADDRGNLALQFLALAGRLRPRWVVWENVPGVLSSNEGRDFGSFVGGLGELGYGWAYRTLDAQFFGLAQRRKRVFVVGYLGDWRRAAAVLFERASLRGDPPPRREAGQRAPTIPSRSTAGGGLGTDFDLDGGLDQAAACDVADTQSVGANQTTGFVGDCVAEPLARSLRARANASHREDSDTYIPVISPALKSRDYKGPSSEGDGDGAPLIAFNLTPSNSNKDFNAREAQYAQAITGNGNRVSARGGDLIAHSLRAEGFDASEDGTGRGTPIVPVCFGWQNSSHQGASASEDHSPTLDKSKVPAIAFALRGREGGAMPEVHDQVSALRSASGGSTRDFVALPIQYAEQHDRDKRANGMGLGEPGDPMFTLETRQPHGDAVRSAVRRLTPKEAARLQGFPDTYLSDVRIKGKPPADGPMYRALGNSMAVPCMLWLGRRIALVDALPIPPCAPDDPIG